MTATTVPLALDDLNNGETVQVAQFFTPSDPAAVSADFTATLNWDGTFCPCTIVPADGGGFDVYATAAAPFAGSSGPITITIWTAAGLRHPPQSHRLCLTAA